MKEHEIQELFQNNPAVEEEMIQVKTVEELQTVFARYGIVVDEDELDKLMAGTLIAPEGEVSEEELADVAGGALTWKKVLAAWKAGGCIGIAARRLYDKYAHGNANYTYTQNDYLTLIKKGYLPLY